MNEQEVKGQVSTPTSIINIMIEKLFRRRPDPDDYVLDPGCGNGSFIKGILSWCEERNYEPPHIVGIELDPILIEETKNHILGIMKK